ncbi:MAG: V-type ATP synthase subunit D [Gammaproteobacteria bacterium]
MNGDGRAPTRAAVLELMDEQVVVKEAYVFLDEKRLLLAAELLRELHRYQQLSQELGELHTRARDAMQAAVGHHGLNGLQVYPAGTMENAEWVQTTRNFMGVTLTETELKASDNDAVAAPAVYASAAAERCRQLFRNIVINSAVLAGVSGNLHRLLAEYRVTERRSRALENIILPEIDQALYEMSSHLEELDLEDAIRVHLQSK